MYYVIRSTEGTTYTNDNETEKIFNEIDEAKNVLALLNLQTTEDWKIISLTEPKHHTKKYRDR